jgi:hypothetical protein
MRRYRGPEDNWMDGRAVYARPEGRASNAALRDIFGTPEARELLSRAVRESVADREGLTDADIDAEAAEFYRIEAERAAEGSRAPENLQ